MQALKGAEQFVDISHIEACAVVPHEKDAPPIIIPRANLDVCLGSPGCELPGIPDQVLEQDLQELLVSRG